MVLSGYLDGAGVTTEATRNPLAALGSGITTERRRERGTCLTACAAAFFAS